MLEYKGEEPKEKGLQVVSEEQQSDRQDRDAVTATGQGIETGLGQQSGGGKVRSPGDLGSMSAFGRILAGNITGLNQHFTGLPGGSGGSQVALVSTHLLMQEM